MSGSEDEPYNCVDCGWSGHKPERITWYDYGESVNQFVDLAASPGHPSGTFYTGSYGGGGYNRCPECGAHVRTASRVEYDRVEYDGKLVGLIAVFWALTMIQLILGGVS